MREREGVKKLKSVERLLEEGGGACNGEYRDWLGRGGRSEKM